MSESRTVQRKVPVPAELQGLRPAGSYTFDELYRLAQVCHASGLFEDITDAAQAMMKIMKGQELGLPPTTAMSGFDIIRKRLFVKPWVIAAKINTCGYGAYRVVTQTSEECTILFSRRHAVHGWYDCPPVSYTYAEARAHGLVDRSPHWKANPAHMLFQRCMGRGGAMYFPEVLAGIAPTPEVEPIPPERHRQTVVDLFGETDMVHERLHDARHGMVNTATGEVVETTDATSSGPASRTGVQNSEAAGGLSGGSETMEAVQPAWRTILETQSQHLERGQLRAACRFALRDPHFPDEEGDKLAHAVLDARAALEAGTQEEEVFD